MRRSRRKGTALVALPRDRLLLFEIAVGLRRSAVVVGAEAREHGFEALAVFIAQDDESQAKASATLYMANDGVGLNAALLNEKVEFGGHTFLDFEMRSLDEEAVDADVEDAGDVIAAIAAPTNPNVV
ncbi:MAG: hypothetical protein WCA94_09335 [Candidatus Acidiferrum sp.]|jgi:hypothetical protein